MGVTDRRHTQNVKRKLVNTYQVHGNESDRRITIPTVLDAENDLPVEIGDEYQMEIVVGDDCDYPRIELIPV